MAEGSVLLKNVLSFLCFISRDVVKIEARQNFGDSRGSSSFFEYSMSCHTLLYGSNLREKGHEKK